MSALARVGVLTFILVAALAPPPAAAADCVQVIQLDWGQGLRVIANTGRQVAFGIISENPGDGQGLIVIFTPSACGPLGLGVNESDATHGGDEAARALQAAPKNLPLP